MKKKNKLLMPMINIDVHVVINPKSLTATLPLAEEILLNINRKDYETLREEARNKKMLEVKVISIKKKGKSNGEVSTENVDKQTLSTSL